MTSPRSPAGVPSSTLCCVRRLQASAASHSTARPCADCASRTAHTSPVSSWLPGRRSRQISSSMPPVAIRRRAGGLPIAGQCRGKSAAATASCSITAATTDSAASRCHTRRFSVGRAATSGTSRMRSSSVTTGRSVSASWRLAGRRTGGPCANPPHSSASPASCRVWRLGWTPPSRSAPSCRWVGSGTRCVRQASTAYRSLRDWCRSETRASHTNPTFAFGLSLSFGHASTLADAAEAAGDDVELVTRFDQSVGADAAQRYEAVSTEDRDHPCGCGPARQSIPLIAPTRCRYSCGRSSTAWRQDAAVLRAVCRRINMLDPVDALAANEDLLDRAEKLFNELPSTGAPPPRTAMLAALFDTAR